MAKSLRSKFKRKMRSIARAKKAPKELALLGGVVARREAYELQQSTNMEALKDTSCSEENESMELTEENVNSGATLNVKTMKKADGTYPSWLSNNQKNKLSKKLKAAKKNKANKARRRR